MSVINRCQSEKNRIGFKDCRGKKRGNSLQFWYMHVEREVTHEVYSKRRAAEITIEYCLLWCEALNKAQKNRQTSPTMHRKCKCKYYHSTVQTDEGRRQKFHQYLLQSTSCSTSNDAIQNTFFVIPLIWNGIQNVTYLAFSNLSSLKRSHGACYATE